MGVQRVNGGIEKNQWRHWSGSMGVLKRVNEGIDRVNGGIVKRVNGGIGQGIGQGQWGHWSGSMGVLKRVNAGRWSGSMGAWRRVRIRQGCGCGSDRRLSYRVVSSTLQGCKLYLAGL